MGRYHLAAFALVLAAPLAAQPAPEVDSFEVYRTCFDKAATELFAAGTKQADKLEKAARKACKAERDEAIFDEQVRFMMDSRLMANYTRADMIRGLDRAIAKPVMMRLGFEGY